MIYCSTRVPRVQFGVSPNCERAKKSQDECFLIAIATKVSDETSETTRETRVLNKIYARVRQLRIRLKITKRIMKTNKKDIWFPAKKYGWGWGLPCAWQGWVVYAVWFALFFPGAIFLAPRNIVLFVVGSVVLSIVFLTIVVIKGEKPRWRWGGD